MTSRWKLDEKHIGLKLKKVGMKMQQASKQIIVLNLSDYDDKEIIILSVDGVNYRTTEFRLDPSTDWYDHKHNGPGLTYEYAVSVHHVSSRLHNDHCHPNRVTTDLFTTDLLYPLLNCVAILRLD